MKTSNFENYDIDGINMEIAVNNIIESYMTTPEQLYSAGKTWYQNANKIASVIAETYGLTLSQVSGIIAALSPQRAWKRNINLTYYFIENRTCGHTSNAVEKALRILDGEDPLNVLGGQKTLNFYRNIFDPNCDQSVTIDRHAIRITGIDRTTVTTKQYSFLASAYKQASKRIKTLPQIVQAVTWCNYRQSAL